MKKHLVFMALLATSLMTMGFPGCEPDRTVDDPNTAYERVPSLSLVPREGFVPEPGFHGPENARYVENGEPYFNGAYVIEAKASEVHIGMTVTNEGDEDIEFLVINMFTQDPQKFVLGKVSGWGFLWPNIHVPAPSMLADNEPMYYGQGDLDPYPGFVNYIGAGPLKRGESFNFDAYLGVGEGELMHFEAAGMIGPEEDLRWAIPLPKSGTTLVVTAPPAGAPTARRLTEKNVKKKMGTSYKFVPRPSTR